MKSLSKFLKESVPDIDREFIAIINKMLDQNKDPKLIVRAICKEFDLDEFFESILDFWTDPENDDLTVREIIEQILNKF